MPVSWQISQDIERSGRPVRNDAFRRRSFPGGCLRGELEPRRPKVHVVRDRRAADTVDALRHSLENRALRDQPSNRPQ